MALFKKKPPANGDEGGDGKGESGASTFTPQPEKARKWFEHAKTAAMSSNYDYALSCFANGIRLDPMPMSSHESMFEAAVRYMNQGAKPAASREIRSIDDGTPVGKFAAAEFEWMKDLKNPKVALKALEAAVKAEQLEFGHWIAPKVLNLVRSQKKLTKSVLIQAMELFRQVGAWEASMAAGELARSIDPSDSQLDAELKNLSAQRAMEQGGYDQAAGQEGAFRKFIKDADRQQELIEEETLAAGTDVETRNLERARLAYEETPNAPDVINRYAQLMKKQGTPEAVERAAEIYAKGFEDTGEYRFRMHAGDIRIERLEGRERELTERLEDRPDDTGLRAELESTRSSLLQLKAEEYESRVRKYPTDRHRKYDYGTVLFALGNFDEAMAQFQKAKDEPKLRVRAGHMLGRCFFAETWYSEAAAELKEALQALEVTEKDRELPIKYDLMLALLELAKAESAVDVAREAKEICSEIARRDITYRDIREKRKEVDDVIRGMGG